MAVGFVLAAAFFAAFANFFFRKNIEKGGASSAFLSLYFIISLSVALLLTPELSHAKFSVLMCSLGCIAGLLNFLMMSLTARSLELGPPGLTFTFQNASSLIPGLLLFFLFGTSFGFLMTPGLIAGFILIVLGLYFSARAFEKGDEKAHAKFWKWLIFALAMLSVQGIILSIFQWRVLFFSCPVDEPHWLLPWSCHPDEDVWFMPAFFLLPALLQFLLFWRNEKRKFTSSEWVCGSSAGALNCLAMLFLLLATKTEGDLNKGMLFPLFTVSVILFCNLWGRKIYREKVNWTGITLCLIGVAVGMIFSF